ncbi:unnamed protein product [Leptosia nina]|uniref:Uncharacterized protein n=1 Tax=Leptosia nina TaxID=320188 RepID=A0AAV1JGM5_9NEOP
MLRRFLDSSPGLQCTLQAGSNCIRASKIFSLENQHGKVDNRSNEIARGFRHTLEPMAQQKVDSREQINTASEILGITSISAFQSLIGLLNFVSFAVTQGRLHFRNALVFLNRQLKESLVHETVIPQKVKEDLVWWLANLRKPA